MFGIITKAYLNQQQQQQAPVTTGCKFVLYTQPVHPYYPSIHPDSAQQFVIPKSPQLQGIITSCSIINFVRPFCSPLMTQDLLSLEKPHVNKQDDYGHEKAQPCLPADAGPLGHQEHPVHGAAQAKACLVEAFVHLFGERGGLADFIAYGYCHLHRKLVWGGNERGKEGRERGANVFE